MNFGNGDEIRVASQLHTGVLSPSKDSYMPALIEVGNDRTRRIRQLKALGEKEAKAQAERQVAEVVPITSAQLMQRDAELAQRMMKKRKYREKHVLQILFDHEKFAKLQQDFERNDGVLDLEKFLISVLVNFDIYQYTGSDEDAAEEVKGGDSEDEGDNVSTGPFFDSSASSGPSRPQSRAHFHATASSAARGEDPAAADPHATADLLSISPELLFNVASIVELFRQIDVHSVGEITWEEASTLLIEQGKRASSADGATLTLDTKSYHESAIQDTTKHDANVERIVYVKEINALATFSQSRKFRIYDPKRLTLKAEVSGHRGSVITCAYIEPMAQLATCASDMTICLWDATSMKLRSRIVCRDVQICLCYHASVDPSCLYSGSIDGTLSKWHLTTLSLKESRRGHKGEINDLLVLPDMLLIASASSDGTIILWDIQTFRPKKHLKGHKKSVLQLAYSMGCLLSVGLDQEALVWNPYVETSHLFKLKGHAHSLVGIGVGVGSYPQLVTGDIGGILRVWDVRNFRCAQVFGATDAVTDLTCFCVIPELKRIACGVGNIRLYDYVDSREHGAMGDGGSSGRAEEETDPLGVRCCAWEPHRGRFVTLSRKNLKIWDAETGCMIRMLKDLFPGIPNELTAFCVSSNARKLIVGNAHGTIASFSTNGKFMREFSVPNAVGEEVTQMALYDSPIEGPLVVSGSGRGTVKVHLDTGSSLPNCKAEFTGAHGDAVVGLSVGQRQDKMASWSTDGTVVLYDMKTLKIEQTLALFSDLVVGVEFLSVSHSGINKRNLMIIAEAGGSVSVFDKADKEAPWKRIYQWNQVELLPYYATQADLTSMKVHSNGVKDILVYLGDMKGQVRVWDMSPCFQYLIHMELQAQQQQQHAGLLGSGGGGILAGAGNRKLVISLAEMLIHTDSVTQIDVVDYMAEENPADDESGKEIEGEAGDHPNVYPDSVLLTVGLDKKVYLSTCRDLTSRGILCQNVNDRPAPVRERSSLDRGARPSTALNDMGETLDGGGADPAARSSSGPSAGSGSGAGGSKDAAGGASAGAGGSAAANPGGTSGAGGNTSGSAAANPGGTSGGASSSTAFGSGAGVVPSSGIALPQGDPSAWSMNYSHCTLQYSEAERIWAQIQKPLAHKARQAQVANSVKNAQDGRGKPQHFSTRKTKEAVAQALTMAGASPGSPLGPARTSPHQLLAQAAASGSPVLAAITDQGTSSLVGPGEEAGPGPGTLQPARPEGTPAEGTTAGESSRSPSKQLMDASAVTGESSEAPALSGGQQLPPQVDDNSPPNQLLSSQFLEQVGSIDLEDVESADFETVCQAIATRPPRAKQQSRTGVFGSSRERGQRKKPLSEKEYSAGLRLAKALDALGEDETGDISAMAKSLRPGRR